MYTECHEGILKRLVVTQARIPIGGVFTKPGCACIWVGASICARAIVCNVSAAEVCVLSQVWRASFGDK